MSVVWGCAACLACMQPPDAQFARQLDRAASWADAVEFAAVPPARDATPPAYRQDLDRRAAADLDKIALSLFSLDVESSRREAAARACDRLAALLSRNQPRPEDLRSAADTLRDLAAEARGGLR